ncbi:hypothetical protein F2P81_023440 [Scophthalmus maximus]|uniref:Uncharacterized protein n=1 Tax=Scophthalmus maximus TaxID=52904 RepID=A0A6A4RXI4_SCOMX|nr:hypothetical protein F2P81_023440 [Scophthalmus maximus]
MIPDQSESVMLVSSAVPTKSPPVTSVWVGLNRRVWYWSRRLRRNQVTAANIPANPGPLPGSPSFFTRRQNKQGKASAFSSGYSTCFSLSFMFIFSSETKRIR